MPKDAGTSEFFWENQVLVTRQNSYHVPQCRANHSTTQGSIALTKLFNMEVDSVVCHWLSMMLEDDTVIQDILGSAVG